MHKTYPPLIQAWIKIILWIAAAPVILVLSYLIFIFCFLFAIGSLKIVGF